MTTKWLASVVTGSSSTPPVRFCVGDTVEVLRATRLPKVEDVIGTGVIEAVLEPTAENHQVESLYLVRGFPILRSGRVLRLVRRAR
jgi:hypothetical protein